MMRVYLPPISASGSSHKSWLSMIRQHMKKGLVKPVGFWQGVKNRLKRQKSSVVLLSSGVYRIQDLGSKNYLIFISPAGSMLLLRRYREVITSTTYYPNSGTSTTQHIALPTSPHISPEAWKSDQPKKKSSLKTKS